MISSGYVMSSGYGGALGNGGVLSSFIGSELSISGGTVFINVDDILSSGGDVLSSGDLS